MPRRKHYIKRIDRKDETVLKAFYCCQHLTLDSITNLISLHRLNTYIKEQIVERELYLPKLLTDKPQEVFALTKKGQKYIKEHIVGMRYTHPYQSSTAVSHNLKLSEVYFQSVRYGTQWLTERDLQQLFFDSIRERDDYQQLLEDYRDHKISVPDGAIVRDNEIVLVEVTTPSYLASEQAAKKNFSDCLSIPIDYYQTQRGD